ncbi:MAG: hypothetical protein HYT70_04480 [Candidatus Aenigmarchaeota archaeon]|nr:hypothetical protein [Candidatus Aenigmarchaeota archaeon]
MTLGLTDQQRKFVIQAAMDGDLRRELEESSVLNELPGDLGYNFDLYDGEKTSVLGRVLAVVINHYGREGFQPVYSRFGVTRAVFDNWRAMTGVKVVKYAELQEQRL